MHWRSPKITRNGSTPFRGRSSEESLSLLLPIESPPLLWIVIALDGVRRYPL